MRSHLYTILKFLIGWPFSILAFLFMVRIIFSRGTPLLDNIHRVNPPLLGFGMLFFIIFFIFRSIIWHRLLKNFSYKIHYKTSGYLWAVSELKRYIPGNFWSLVGRTLLFEKIQVKKKDVGSCLVFEAEYFVLGCTLISLLSLPFLIHYHIFNISAAAGEILTGFVIILILLFIYNKKFISFIPGRYHTWAQMIFPKFPPEIRAAAQRR